MMFREWKQVEPGEWWRLFENSIGVGWVRFSAQKICNGKYCHIDSGLCELPENIVAINPRYIGWRDGHPILYWFKTKREAMEAVEKQGE